MEGKGRGAHGTKGVWERLKKERKKGGGRNVKEIKTRKQRWK